MARAHALVQSDDRFGAGQKQRQRLFRHGGGIHADCRDDLDAPFGGCRLVDGVGAAAMLGDHAQGGGGVHRRGADFAVAHDDGDRVVFAA
ncbi:hypothetical protein D3C71_1826920 [compost metagenome]